MSYTNKAITKLTLPEIENFFKSLNGQLVKQCRNYFLKKEGIIKNKALWWSFFITYCLSSQPLILKFK
ncbi:hypothetical protein [Burkholderia multivorans]|uniref:hypothetical protein n=1 Tax=Burkholderia multivorans TaxID=87883 RepID=UPI0011B258B5|nr:hypothetical protein [Burkholderia multivorans]